MKEQIKTKEEQNKEVKVIAFIVDGREYAMELAYVTEIIYYRDVMPVPKAPKFIEGVVELRGFVIPVVNLAGQLKIRNKKKKDEEEKPEHIIIVKFGKKKAGIIVDEVKTVLNIVEKKFQYTKDHGGESSFNLLKGIFKKGDDIIMLIDINKLLSKTEIKQLEAAV